MVRRISTPEAEKSALMASGEASGPKSWKCVTSLSVRKGITMPERSMTPTCLASSLAPSMMTEGRMAMPANSTGARKVISRKLFFLTLLRYSRWIIMPNFLKFIPYSSSVTSLIKMSFMRGISSLKELMVKSFSNSSCRRAFTSSRATTRVLRSRVSSVYSSSTLSRP